MRGSFAELEASRFIRAELLRRGLTRRGLAALVGMNVDNVANLMCGNNRAPASRWKIETVLGMAIWSTPEEFSARKQSNANTQATSTTTP